MIIGRAILILLLVGYAGVVHSQKQLVLLKGERVLLRLYPGDDFVYRQEGSKSLKVTYVNNLSETAVITHRDTVPFHTIDRLYFSQHKFYNTVGTALVIFGAGLFLIDQINIVLVQGNPPSLDDRVSAISLSALSAGLPLMLIRKQSQRITHRHRLMMVDKGSAFYRQDSRQYILPFDDQ